MYVIPLGIVVGIVYWLASNAFALLVTHVVDPSLRQAYRADGTRNRRGYLRSIAAVRGLALIGTTVAIFFTCDYYAENNRPPWIAWTVFGVAFLGLTARGIVAEAARVVRAN